jgi:hypothetical protein
VGEHYCSLDPLWTVADVVGVSIRPGLQREGFGN